VIYLQRKLNTCLQYIFKAVLRNLSSNNLPSVYFLFNPWSFPPADYYTTSKKIVYENKYF
jgi:hypothetical protein